MLKKKKCLKRKKTHKIKEFLYKKQHTYAQKHWNISFYYTGKPLIIKKRGK